jgi:hypothetical protein
MQKDLKNKVKELKVHKYGERKAIWKDFTDNERGLSLSEMVSNKRLIKICNAWMGAGGKCICYESSELRKYVGLDWVEWYGCI